jgi:transcriptional regulator with XRE-family HTH domain
MVKQGDRFTLGELRRIRGITQRQVADAMGVTGKAVSEWERGINEPHITPLQTQKMMEAYGCDTVQELVDAVAACRQQNA